MRSTSMSNLLPTQPEPQAITFVRRTIHIGPAVVDGFMLPNGEFRQGLSSTGRAIGKDHRWVSRVVSTILAPGAKPLQRNGSQPVSASKSPGNGNPAKPLQRKRSRGFGPTVVEEMALPSLTSEPVLKLHGRPESLLSLQMAQLVWEYEARNGSGSSQDAAWDLMRALAGVSLERSYQESFGVSDSRTQDDRLLDFFINWNIGPYRRLFDDQFQIQFKRVTGYDINSCNSFVKFRIAEFLYNRLPAQVYEALQDLNPEDEKGKRKYKHHQLITDDAKAEVVMPIISALKAFMSVAPTGDVKFVNESMDKVYPTQRGRRMRKSQARFDQMAMC